MLKIAGSLALSIGIAVTTLPSMAGDVKATTSRAGSARIEHAGLWRDPVNISSRNLFYGPGGEKDQPRPPFTFLEEDMNGTNPKYVVRDANDVKWTVKLGPEARPETVASRMVWAVGYFANEDYFLADLRVDKMPSHLNRGRDLVGRDGTMHAARLKRHLKDEKKIEQWSWRHDPFSGTRELNGLKVMMALVNNWDMKDQNNAIYGDKKSAEEVYLVSDLGASFGSSGLSLPISHAKGYFPAYANSRFITKIAPDYVDFRTPSRPPLIYVFKLPEFISRMRITTLGKHIPRDDARWVGHLLSGLSQQQIRDAFRSAGYTPEQVEAFSKVVQQRIAQLNSL